MDKSPLKMNVDKFGHHVHKRLRLSSEKIDGQLVLVRFQNGDYDFHTANLKGVKAPIDSNDAVNKEYVDSKLEKYCTLQQMYREISNLRANLLLVLNKQVDNNYKKLEKEKVNSLSSKNE